MMWQCPFLLALLLNLAHANTSPYPRSSENKSSDVESWPPETYHSTSILGVSVNFVEQSPQCNDGEYILLSLHGEGVATPGPTILDQDGQLVWTRKSNYPGAQVYNLDVHTYQGQDYLTFWEGDDQLDEHGDGAFYMLDSSYNEVYKVCGQNGLSADLHEFQITHNETALFTVYDIVSADLRSVNGPQRGWIWDGRFVEVDIGTGDILFEWRASHHFNFTEVFLSRGDAGKTYEQPWDFFHINSVDKDTKGNFLISALYTDHLTYIDGRTGAILWRLGGDHSDFKDLSNGAASTFAWQHHARFRDNDTAITLFDNASPHDIGTSRSRGLYLDLDTSQMTVKIHHEYTSPDTSTITPQSQGSLQLLDTGNVLLSYGLNAAAWTEFAMNGSALCHAYFGSYTTFSKGGPASYRIAKRPWKGYPSTTPDFEISGHEAAVSWNGATEVATWVLEGASVALPNSNIKFNTDSNNEVEDEDGEEAKSKESFVQITSIPKSGFETIITIPVNSNTDKIYPFLRVRALDALGSVLGTTAILPFDPDSTNSVPSPPTNEDENLRPPTNPKTHSYIISITCFIVLTGCILVFRRCACGLWLRRWRYHRARRWKEEDDDEWEYRYGNEEREFALDGLSDGDESDEIEFSLLENPRLSPRPNFMRQGSGYVSNGDGERERETQAVSISQGWVDNVYKWGD